MYDTQKLRMLMEQRLLSVVEEIFGLFERTIAEYEEELSRTKMKKDRQQEIPDTHVLKSQLSRHRSDFRQVPKEEEEEEEIPSEQQEWSYCVGREESDILHIKEEEEELTEDGDHNQSEEERQAWPRTQQITEADKDINSEPDSIFAPLSDMDDMVSDSSVTNHSDDTNKHLETNQNSKGDTSHKDFRQVPEEEEEEEQQEWTSCVGREESNILHIKEEEEELVEPLRGLRENEDAHQSEEERQACLRTQQITEADEDIKSEPDSIFAPLSDMDDMTSDFSVTNHSDDTNKHLETNQNSKGDTSHQGEKRFPHKISVKRHLAGHSEEEKPFVCSVCPKTFGSNQYLKRHTMIHTKERYPSCSVCGKRFRDTFEIKEHMNKHTGERPFTCSLCKKSFGRRATLRTHLKTQHGEKKH